MTCRLNPAIVAFMKRVVPTPAPTDPWMHDPASFGQAIRAARTAAGMTLFDLPPSRAERDLEQWQPIIHCVEAG